ncbi:MAG: hypothetical protein ACLFWI_10955 [Coleofasciculus sp.]|uniref:hypothetical protein n=1 Tax=Coleofasciculus sp. TaxID=3100458 RepID=UPI003A484912
MVGRVGDWMCDRLVLGERIWMCDRLVLGNGFRMCDRVLSVIVSLVILFLTFI